MKIEKVQINPMYALAVNAADLRRRFILFCGAGISRDAEIPTASDILADMKRKIYQQETKLDNFLEKDFLEWIEKNDKYKEMGYSECLDYLFPGIEQRRLYLNSFFAEKSPGDVHRSIASLIKFGAFRFVITTNFDNLIEKALDEEGLADKYSVISTNDQAEHSDAWDKVDICRIYKIHGDKDQGMIRNTIKELDNLGASLRKDFQEIIDRHGVIVLGYSGSDAAIMDCFEKREHLKYPIYWQYRSKVNKRVEGIIGNQDGRFIQYDSAGKFLSELLERIELVHTTENLGNTKNVSNRMKKMLTQSKPKELIIKIEDERKEFLTAVSIAYESLKKGASWEDIWGAYVELLRKFKTKLELGEQILKLGMEEAWDEYLKLFPELHSINAENERYGSNGLINQLFYSILLLIGSRALKHDKYSYLRRILNIKRLSRNRYIQILDWNIIGDFLEGKNNSGETKYYVPRLEFFLDIVESEKLFPTGETWESAKNCLLDFDNFCFIYTAKYQNSEMFPFWYPCSAYYFDYRSPDFLIKLTLDKQYLQNFASILFELDADNFITFLKEKAMPQYNDLIRKMPGFPNDNPFRIVFEKIT